MKPQVATPDRAARAPLGTNDFSKLAVAACALGSLALFALLFEIPVGAPAVLLIGSLLCGLAEIDNLCGLSHLGTLTPLSVVDPARNLWKNSVRAYFLGGLLSSSVVGAFLGLIGSSLPARESSEPVLGAIVIGISAALVLRELRIVRFVLPQVAKQTHKVWAFQFGIVTAAGMWGAHIGVGFASVLRHGGLYIVALTAAQHADVSFAASLFGTYWAGRCLPLILAPYLTAATSNGGDVEMMVSSVPWAYRLVAITGITCLAAVAGLSIRG